MEPIERKVLANLGELGLNAQRVKETNEKRPDFLCHDSANQTYWIELKSKDASEDEKKRYTSDLAEGKVAETLQVIRRNNSISAVIRDASRQLSTVAQAEDIRLVWLHAKGIDKASMTDKIKASLYGLCELVEAPNTKIRDSADLRSFTCFFFSNSDFFLRRDSIDGIIVSKEEGYQLHVNPFSPRARRLRNSFLAGALPTFDVEAWDGQPGLMVANTNLDRTKHFEVLTYLQKKYKTAPLVVMSRYAYSSNIAF